MPFIAQSQELPPQRSVQPQRAATAAELRTAFEDDGARALLARARVARATQDSALTSYNALTNVRYMYGMRLPAVGFERLIMRSDQVARVRWSQRAGASIEPLGERNVAPVGVTSISLTAPIPYWTGRDALWMPIDDLAENDNLFHPLAQGAEAHYRYALGASLNIHVENGNDVHLREMRITARRPDWHAIVGTFWFDTLTGSLTRAAYRLGGDVDFWKLGNEEERRKSAENMRLGLRDTAQLDSALKFNKDLQKAKSVWGKIATKVAEQTIERFAEGSLQPLGIHFNGVTIEYGLHQGKFWLPRQRMADIEVSFGPLRVPASVNERFQYDDVSARVVAADTSSVTSADSIALMTNTPRTLPPFRSIAASDSLIKRFQREAMEARAAVQEARNKGDSVLLAVQLEKAKASDEYASQAARQQSQCTHDSTYFAGTMIQADGAFRVAYQLKCNSETLKNAAELPPEGEAADNLFNSADLDAMFKGLNMSLQPGWMLQSPRLMAGLSMLRYNRVEGLSVGLASSSNLGGGVVARGEGRYGFGDDVPNGELSFTQSGGNASRSVRIFKRLGVANDGFGSPLSFGASLGNLLFGRDEGFYYRTYGAEFENVRLPRSGTNGSTFKWRLFAERQYSAGVLPNTQGSLANRWGSARFVTNIDATRLTALGASDEIFKTFGSNPTGTRLSFRSRSELALTLANDSASSSKGKTSSFARLMFDATLSRPLGIVSGAVTAAAGSSVGTVPVQRSFFMGGLYSVRGQFALPDGEGRVGNSFWLGRAEFGLLGSPLIRPSIFADAGWAGARGALFSRSKPLTGIGAGLSIIDGLIRFDASRGIWPEKRWRYSLYLGARF